jgi:hypothetical protein
MGTQLRARLSATFAADWQRLSRAQLRQFALLAAALMSLAAGLLIPWMRNHPVPYWPWAVGAVLALLAIAWPAAIRPIYSAWMLVARALNRVFMPLLIGALYFLVLTPFAFVLRLCGFDPLARRFDAGASSYRVASRKSPARKMERPF